MCVGAVYDAYHYAIDVAAGALLGMVVGATFTIRYLVKSEQAGS